MGVWQQTHGTVRGAFLQAGKTQLYVRQAKDNPACWLLYVDGELEAAADSQVTAMATGELAARCMVDADSAGAPAAAA